jgi:DNA-binding transcriptional ArsR family regulator
VSRNEESGTDLRFESDAGSDAGAGGEGTSGDASEPGDADDEVSDALAVLAEETRVRILRMLAEAEDPMAFSELRRAVGVADAGRFNYHLSRVCEHFVREVEEGYELDRAGARLVTAADVDVAGREPEVTDAVEPDPGEPCPVYGEPDCGKLFHVHLSPRGPAPR